MRVFRVPHGRSCGCFGLNGTVQAKVSAAVPLLALVLLACGGCGGGETGTKPEDRPPAINGVLLDPRRVAPGDTVAATAVAGDPEGVPLTFLWRVNSGVLLDSTSVQATWVAPSYAASCSLTVFVSDAANQTSLTSVVPVGVGTLVVESYPQGAAVYIDDELTGYVTPATITAAPAGSYSVSVEQAGFMYYPATRSALVTHGATATVMFGLNQAHMTLTQLTVSDFAFQSSWSPDGSRLACATEDDLALYRKIEIFQSPWPDYVGEYLETMDEPDWAPSWGPGDQILFASSRGGAVPRVYVVSLAGGPPDFVYPTEANFPAWSWDGEQIALVAANGAVHDLIVRPASELLPVTVAQDVVEDRPAWKPDDSQIAFSKLVGGQPYIFTVPSTGGTPEQVSHVPGTHPQWSPDGSTIAFVSSYGGTTGVWVLLMEEGPEPLDGWLTATGEDWPTWKPDTGELCFTAAASADSRTLWLAQDYPF
ncbi:MAG: PEGA domain-containing protein [Candidatus Eisenbacteria bacterium]|nr:PEGA domain-containing protein [Candidatus Eisenbacteria bacterium]